MASNSKIEWTDHTFNPWTGCTNISPGCDNCYAEAWSKRSGHVKWGNSPRKRTTEAYWKGPRMWQRRAGEFEALNGRRQRVFCASLADVFDNQVPPEWRSDLFQLIKECPSLDWLFLTKRPQNISKMLPPDWESGYSNVWLGFTAEDQVRYDQRWKVLKKVSAAVKFVSYEPAIGPVVIGEQSEYPDWLIVGGESGHNVRPMEPKWATDIIAECRQRGIAPFFKQWGHYKNNPIAIEGALSAKELENIDPHGKGGGLLENELIREFPIAQELCKSVA